MIYFATKKGKHHSQSEDSVLIGNQVYYEVELEVPIPENGLFAIADGVGGNYGGSKASQQVLNDLANMYSSEADLGAMLREINMRLIVAGKEEPKYSNMATTLTGICIDNEQLVVMHIGNSRAYVLQGKYLKQITSDHTVYNWLLSNHRYEEAEQCNKNEITNCFGGGNAKLISRLSIERRAKCKTIVCTTDGVHEYVELESIEDVVNSTMNGIEKCKEILSLALQAGSSDDLSVLLYVEE